MLATRQWSHVNVLQHHGILMRSCLEDMTEVIGMIFRSFMLKLMPGSPWQQPGMFQQRDVAPRWWCMKGRAFSLDNGSNHLNDVHLFAFDTKTWSPLLVNSPGPIPRNAHVAVTHGNSINLSLVVTLTQDLRWIIWMTKYWNPSNFRVHPRDIGFAMWDACTITMVIFGGYDDRNRLMLFASLCYTLVVPPDARNCQESS